MNNFSINPKEFAGKEYTPSEEDQESIFPDLQERNIIDGGEFLDDALRMKDQPLKTKDEEQQPSSE